MPSVFQCFINDVLRQMLGEFIIAYIDVYSRSLTEHIEHVKRVLLQLR